MDKTWKFNPETVAKWLRRCSEDEKVADYCYCCPFDDGVHNCMDYLHYTAADMLDKLSELKNRR